MGWVTLLSFIIKKQKNGYEVQGFKDRTNSRSPNLTLHFTGVEIEVHRYSMNSPSGIRIGFSALNQGPEYVVF